MRAINAYVDDDGNVRIIRMDDRPHDPWFADAPEGTNYVRMETTLDPETLEAIETDTVRWTELEDRP